MRRPVDLAAQGFEVGHIFDSLVDSEIAIQDCGDVQHEILLKLLFCTAVRVSELVHIEVGDVDLDARKIFINRGKGAKCVATHFWHYVAFPLMWRWLRKPRTQETKLRWRAT